jgi:predicted secreted protein
MKIKLKVCIAIMLTIILGVNVIAFASYENITTSDVILKNNNEFEYNGTTTGKFVSAREIDKEEVRYVVTTTIMAISIALIFYFLVKIMVYFRLNKRYKKAIKEGRKVEKPNIKIKLKYILLLFIAIDILIWIIVILMNLL